MDRAENEKINIEVCIGTTCFVMGASKLQDLKTLIPPRYKSFAQVEYKACMNLCKEMDDLKAPFVKVGDEVVTQATLEKIIGVLERKING